MDANPGARLAFVGKGPMDDEMKRLFEGYPVHFAGQLIGNLFHIIVIDIFLDSFECLVDINLRVFNIFFVHLFSSFLTKKSHPS